MNMEKIYGNVNESMDNILKNIKFKIEKYQPDSILNSFISDMEQQQCKNMTYDFGNPKKQKQLSSVNISCCGKDCIMESDIVTSEEEQYKREIIKKLFDKPTCAVTDIHEHENEIHVHTLCRGYVSSIETNLKSLHSTLIY